MGNTRSYYEQLIKQKYEKLCKAQIESQGPIVINDKKLEEVLKEVIKDLDHLDPKKSQIKKRFKKFCDEQRTMKRTEPPKNLAYDNKSREVFGNGDKYDQYKKNRNEFLKSCLKNIKKEIAWENTKRSLNLKNGKGEKVTLPEVRWRNFLIKEDGSDASQKHNEELYELIALGSKTIEKETFIQLRKNHYMNLSENPLSDAEAEKKAEDESERVAERIWEMAMEKLDATKEQRKKLPSYASHILSGNAGKNGYPTLEECHRVADDQDQGLLWDLNKFLTDLTDFGKAYGGMKNLKEARKFMLDNQTTGQVVSDSMSQAELASNFYFTMVDPFKLIDRENPIPLESPERAEGTYDEKMRSAFSDTCSQQSIQYSVTNMKEVVKPFGLIVEDDRVIPFMDKDPSIHVIRRETKDAQNQKKVQTAIVRMAKMSDKGPLALITTGPENLVNDGLEKSVKGFMDTCKDWDRERRTSQYFENMRGALENLDDKKLTIYPTLDEIDTLKKQLEALRQTSRDYLDYKIQQRHGEHFRYGFETKRVNLAKKMNEFAVKKLKELQYVKEHVDTVELAKTEEKRLKDDPGYKEYKEKGNDAGVLDYLREKEEAAISAQRLHEREERNKAEAEAIKIQNLAKEKKEKAERKELFSKITNMKNGCEKHSKEHDPAMKLTEQYINQVKAQRPGLEAKMEHYRDDAELDEIGLKVENQAKHLLAGRSIEKMLVDEQTALGQDPGADSTIHELVNGGKLEDLVELLVQNANLKGYIQNANSGISKNGYKLIADHGEYPFRVSKAFREDLANAAKEQKEEAAQMGGKKEDAAQMGGKKEDADRGNRRSLVEGGIKGLMEEAGINERNNKRNHSVSIPEMNMQKQAVKEKG